MDRNSNLIGVNLIVSHQRVRDVLAIVKANIEKETKASEYTVRTCGTKLEELKEETSEESGFWKSPTEVSSKPKRWILHIIKEGHETIVDYARQEDGELFPGSKTVGFINNREGICVAIIFRVMAAIKRKDGTYIFPNWEWLMVMVFQKPLPAGTSGQTISSFDVEKGTISYRSKIYEVAALGIYKTPVQNTDIQLGDKEIVSYDEATEALLEFLGSNSTDRLMSVKEFDLTEESLKEIRKEIRKLITHEEEEQELPQIEPKTDMYGISPNVYEQINASLRSGKRHIIFYGPPGTGKTTLAQYVASELSSSGEYEMLTASFSWTSQELIGGYQPIGGGKIGFVPGIILRNFDRPIVLDELNRCPVDKVMGPLFSVLSGQSSTLPYKVNLEDETSPFHVIYPVAKEDPEAHEWFPTNEWRLIATLNTVDKTQLGQLSYALSRRFAWIKIGVPGNLSEFTTIFMDRVGDDSLSNPIADLWSAVNTIRPIGGAPIIDIIRTIKEMDPNVDLLSNPDDNYQNLLLMNLTMYILPLLDGISRREAEDFVDKVSDILGLSSSKRDDLTKEMEDITG